MKNRSFFIASSKDTRFSPISGADFDYPNCEDTVEDNEFNRRHLIRVKLVVRIKKSGKYSPNLSRSTKIVEPKVEYVRKVERSTSDGVYIIRSGEFYKIGITNDIDGRLSNLQTGNPVKLELMTYKKVANAAKVEKALHHKFSSDNVHGEWFTTSYAKIEAALNRMIETFNY